MRSENMENDVEIDDNSKRKLMFKVLNILQRKSSEALKKAKKIALSEKIESETAREALKYYVNNWKDTLHPGVLGLTCEAVGGELKMAEPMQIVMLFLTASTDLHDDIIDNSFFKNGKPTVYGKYGKNMTLLLGNAMLIKGFTLLYDYGMKLDPKKFKEIVKTIKEELFELGNAHLLEIELRNRKPELPERYLEVLKKKASSIRINAKIGAIIGGGTPEIIDKMAKYGEILGFLIALREEFIDIFEPDELKNRMENETLPLPLLLTLKETKKRNEILDILSKDELPEEALQEIINYVFQNEEVIKLIMYMKDLADEALNLIEGIKMQTKIENELSLLIKGSIEDIATLKE